MSEGRTCGDCGVVPGQPHEPGCDVERCPRCGSQAISCDCIYEMCGIDPGTLEELHPGIYTDGPTEEMYARWDAEWGPRRIPWAGEWPGASECREYGLYCKMTSRGWAACRPDEPGATEDLNRLAMEGEWDIDRQRFVMRGKMP